MVRAILAGRKTQTRRIVKPQPPAGCTVADYMRWDESECEGSPRSVRFSPPLNQQQLWQWWPDRGSKIPSGIACPYGEPGDRLWVRETWGLYDGEGIAYDYSKGIPKICPDGFHVSYPADDESGTIRDVFRWRPSIFMRPWMSRIALEVTAVRVERVQDISEADAIAEGVTLSSEPSYEGWAKREYIALWAHINGARSWVENPWVWVVEFKRVEAS